MNDNKNLTKCKKLLLCVSISKLSCMYNHMVVQPNELDVQECRCFHKMNSQYGLLAVIFLFTIFNVQSRTEQQCRCITEQSAEAERYQESKYNRTNFRTGLHKIQISVKGNK